MPKKAKKTRKTGILDRHKLLLSKMSENVGKGLPVSIRQVAREVGYSPYYADSGRLQKTKSWVQQRDAVLTNELLLKVHHEGLFAHQKVHKIVDRDEDGKPIYDFVDIDDYAVRQRYLDLAYKLRGNYDNTLHLNHTGLNELSAEELRARIAGIVSGALLALTGGGKKKTTPSS